MTYCKLKTKMPMRWIWPDKRGEVNAKGDANSYQATLENPFYNETYGYDEYGREYTLENWYSQWWEDTDFWQNVEGKTRIPRLEDNPLFDYSDIFLN